MDEENNDKGYSAGLWIGGRPVTHVISTGAEGTSVRLDGGGSALIPAGHPDAVRALALPPETPAQVVPAQVTNAQARAALRGAGLFAGVDAAIQAHPDPAVRDAWEYAPYISRDSLLVGGLGQKLGLGDKQIDALFVAAAAIEF